MSENGVGLLSAVEDLHGGVRVELKEPLDYQEFVIRLSASLAQWRLQVWVLSFSFDAKFFLYLFFSFCELDVMIEIINNLYFQM